MIGRNFTVKIAKSFSEHNANPYIPYRYRKIVKTRNDFTQL